MLERASKFAQALLCVEARQQVHRSGQHVLDRTVKARVPGFYRSVVGNRVTVDLGWRFNPSLSEVCKFLSSGNAFSTLKALMLAEKRVRIHDARKFQEEQHLSDSDFFEKHGFALIRHSSSMQSEDWLNSNSDPDEVTTQVKAGTYADFRDSDTPCKRKYAEEVAPLIQDILPNASKIWTPSRGMRRGPGATVYVDQVHADYTRDLDEFVEKNPLSQFTEHRREFEETKANAYMLMKLWRPVLPMQKPVEATPLCICDPRTVKPEDVVVLDIYGNIPGGQCMMGLKYSPEQTWYYYPEMTIDEVLVFRTAHYRKGETTGQMPVFHTMFETPTTPWFFAEPRCSFEYEVGALLH